MDITWINKNDAERIWPQIEPFLVSALKRGLPAYFPCDLLDMVQRDDAQLWIITNNKEEKLYGAALTQIINYPRAKMLSILMLGGKDLKKWKEAWSDALELFAHSEKCDFIQAIGRRGWVSFRGAFESAVVVNRIL